MLLRIVRMTFDPAQIPAFLTLFEGSKSQIRAQPGCLGMELWRDAADPAVFCTYSRWESEAALNAYRQSALFGQVWPATKRLFAAPALAFSSYLFDA
jgi:quinol monooxygenase YgiN